MPEHKSRHLLIEKLDKAGEDNDLNIVELAGGNSDASKELGDISKKLADTEPNDKLVDLATKDKTGTAGKSAVIKMKGKGDSMIQEEQSLDIVTTAKNRKFVEEAKKRKIAKAEALVDKIK